MATPPTVGRIVIYTLSEQDAELINGRRLAAGAHSREHSEHNGTVLHVGNQVTVHDSFPMVITRVLGSTALGEYLVNGSVVLDGNDLHWATSVKQGTGHRTWSWPVKA
jgi:hypothetical protein